MLKRHSEVFRTTLLATDLGLVAVSWLAAWVLRFQTGLPTPLGVPAPGPYFLLLAGIVPLWFALFRAHGLYEPRRVGSLAGEALTVLRATSLGVLLLGAATFFVRPYPYSRGVLLLFWALSFASVAGCRLTIRSLLRAARRRGYNLRHVLVVGGGRVAGELIDRLHARPGTGVRVIGVLTDEGSPRRVRGVRVLGPYARLKAVLREHEVDQVLLALPLHEVDRLEKLLTELDDEVATVRLVPDLLHVLTVRSSVEDLDGLPVISLRQSPLVGWAAVGKRAFDAAIASGLLLGMAPVLALISLAIAGSAGRPVFYTQERMGLDGRVFRMVKFRTMVPDAELETGPVWARRGDRRSTRLGRWLRRYGLDELPQLWNVLRGDMSLVGPRPERPVFIEQFRREIPGYMRRHQVKAGMTGWAQVHGWRGDTSLHERLEHDLYYVENWSLGLDVRVLVLTLWRTLTRRGLE